LPRFLSKSDRFGAAPEAGKASLPFFRQPERYAGHWQHRVGSMQVGFMSRTNLPPRAEKCYFSAA